MIYRIQPNDRKRLVNGVIAELILAPGTYRFPNFPGVRLVYLIPQDRLQLPWRPLHFDMKGGRTLVATHNASSAPSVLRAAAKSLLSIVDDRKP